MKTGIINQGDLMLRPGGDFLKITVVFCLLSLFTNGCWDNREPEWLASSLLLAFDLDEENMYKAIVVLANPLFQAGVEGGAGGGGGNKLPFWVHSARGHTPFEAILNLSQGTTRQIRFSHTLVLLFSEKLAREGIWPVLELFQRNRELRTNIQTAVVDGDLEELLRAEFPLEFLPATAIDRLLRITGMNGPSPRLPVTKEAHRIHQARRGDDPGPAKSPPPKNRLKPARREPAARQRPAKQ